MFLRLATGLFALTLFPTAGSSETVNLRNSCNTWEHVPANKALKSPISALLQCSNDTGTWLALQIMCFTETAEIEFRYRSGYPTTPPTPPAPKTDTAAAVEIARTDDTVIDDTVETAVIPLDEREMLFFDFPKIGVTNVVNYDFDAQNWGYTEKEPLSPLFLKLISGNYADVSLLATGVTERLPLRGSTKALRPVVEACRIAKNRLKKEAEAAPQD